MEHKLHVRKVILARAKLTPLSEEDVAKKVRHSPARGQYDRTLRAGLLTSWCGGGVAVQLIVEREEKAKQMREQGGPASNANLVLEVDVVFSQARNGRMKRLEESLNMGYVGDTTGQGGLLARADGCLCAGSLWTRRMRRATRYSSWRRRTATRRCARCCCGARPTSTTRTSTATRRCTSPWPTTRRCGATWPPWPAITQLLRPCCWHVCVCGWQGTLGEFLIENGADDTIMNGTGLSPYDGLGED